MEIDVAIAYRSEVEPWVKMWICGQKVSASVLRMSLSLCLSSVPVSVYICVRMSVCLCFCLCQRLCLCLCLRLCLRLCLYLCARFGLDMTEPLMCTFFLEFMT